MATLPSCRVVHCSVTLTVSGVPSGDGGRRNLSPGFYSVTHYRVISTRCEASIIILCDILYFTVFVVLHESVLPSK